MANEYDSDANMPFTDNDTNDEEYVQSELGYELWKARELKRFLRDRLSKETADNERKEVERRRNMTDAERQTENLREGLQQKK